MIYKGRGVPRNCLPYADPLPAEALPGEVFVEQVADQAWSVKIFDGMAWCQVSKVEKPVYAEALAELLGRAVDATVHSILDEIMRKQGDARIAILFKRSHKPCPPDVNS